MTKFFPFFIFLCVYCCPEALASSGESSPVKIAFILVNFIIFLFVLYFFIFKKTIGFFKGRGERICKDVEEAAFSKRSALKTYDEMNARLKGVSDEMKTLVDEAIAQGGKIKRDALQTAQKRAEIVLAEGQAMIGVETRIILDHLRKGLARVSVDLAREKIIKKLGKKEQARLIDECISELEAL